LCPDVVIDDRDDGGVPLNGGQGGGDDEPDIDIDSITADDQQESCFLDFFIFCWTRTLFQWTGEAFFWSWDLLFGWLY